MATSAFALRGSEGIWIVNGPPNHDPTQLQRCDETKTCRTMSFSSDGQIFAWANAESVYIMDAATFSVQHKLPQSKVVDLKFSPSGVVLAAWGNYLVDREGSGGKPNMILWDVKKGTVCIEIVQKKQINWEPQWSADDFICARLANNELHFYENNNFETIVNKLHIQKVSGFSIAQGPAPYIVGVYVPGTKGQPSYVRVYRYPDFGGSATALANKSFYKADRVNLYFNRTGTGLVILTSTESSDSSYYGEQSLHYITTNGITCVVPLGKNGPVYCVMWSPKNTEFCVVYGYMPSKATLFNLKCEPVFDFGTGPRNQCFYNPHGNILCLAGFGNLAGNVEFWDLKKQKEISKFKAADTTCFFWAPDGEHFLTATTTPRLRVGNGYKLWHYTGSLVANVPVKDNQELWEVMWKPVPEGTFPEKPVQYKSSQAEQAAEKTEAYRPPQARSSNYSPAKLHEYEPASNLKQAPTDKPASKNKKKREARKAKANQESSDDVGRDNGIMLPLSPKSLELTAQTTGNPETDKKIKAVRKKLQQIEKLKEQQLAGKQLELNQLEKLKSEETLLKELEELELG